MKKLFCLFCLFFINVLLAQNQSKYVVVTIETRSNFGNHKLQFDHWLISIEKWEQNADTAFVTLYLSGFSATDHNECCEGNNLILFNPSSNESFDYPSGLLESQNELLRITTTSSVVVQRTTTRWKGRRKRKVVVRLTPISGTFCICNASHGTNNDNLDFKGFVSVPMTGYSFNSELIKSSVYKELLSYDYSSLPHVDLENIQ
ncbi:MAG TPA: hypothetical protein VF676_02655 [Flavobacterium sp.]|jgi:hypothetical protein